MAEVCISAVSLLSVVELFSAQCWFLLSSTELFLLFKSSTTIYITIYVQVSVKENWSFGKNFNHSIRKKYSNCSKLIRSRNVQPEFIINSARLTIELTANVNASTLLPASLSQHLMSKSRSSIVRTKELAGFTEAHRQLLKKKKTKHVNASPSC